MSFTARYPGDCAACDSPMTSAQPALLDVAPPKGKRYSGPKLTPDQVYALLRSRYGARNPGNGGGPRYIQLPEVRNQAGFGGYWGDGTGRLRSCDGWMFDRDGMPTTQKCHHEHRRTA